MKKIKYLIAAALVGTAAITSCNKGDTQYGAAANDNLAVSNADIIFQVQVNPQRPGYMLQWTAGSMITSEVMFTGTFVNGDPVEQKSYSGKAFNTIDLVTPSVTTVGGVNVPYHDYLRGFFTVALNPINSVTSLELKGQYLQIQPPSGALAPFVPVPVTIAITTPVALNSVMLSNLPINKSRYVATITMDVNQLTNGIDDAALSAAARTDGGILITNESNPNLYGIVVKNLENYFMNVQLSAQNVNVPITPGPVVAIHADIK